MQTKDYTITLDMMRTLPFRPFEVVEGDTGNILHVTLLNNGDPMNLNGCKINIAFASSSGFAMQDETSGIVKTSEAGSFDVSLMPTAYGAGNVSADVQIYSGENSATLVTSTRFDFRCRKSLISGDIIRANNAYPPLVEAARVANEAAAYALAAAARIDTDIGELNVQADWNEQDETQDAFIRNKPVIPLVEGNIGAALMHASRHAANGADAISPAAISAARKSALEAAALLAANWAGQSYTLALASVSASSAVEILPALSITEEQLEALQAANLQDGGQAAGSITLTAFGDVPAIDLPIRVIIRGDLY
ncbi:MAG: BppU family phage baseplate upper protein [Christensenella sp.]|nr:BppU family phage baseplate upper protein [Christensenella sp.]